MDSQINFFSEIDAMQVEVTRLQVEYWNSYSSPATWQFWVIAAMFVGPLIALHFLIDKNKIFQIGFYGFNIHAWSTYADIIGTRLGLWGYYYRLIPQLPFSFALDVSLFPVVLMLIYQWTIKYKKSFYFYSIGAAFAFQFILAPILVQIKFLHIREGVHYFNLFIINVIVIIISKIITKIFLRMHKKTIKS